MAVQLAFFTSIHNEFLSFLLTIFTAGKSDLFLLNKVHWEYSENWGTTSATISRSKRGRDWPLRGTGGAGDLSNPGQIRGSYRVSAQQVNNNCIWESYRSSLTRWITVLYSKIDSGTSVNYCTPHLELFKHFYRDSIKMFTAHFFVGFWGEKI